MLRAGFAVEDFGAVYDGILVIDHDKPPLNAALMSGACQHRFLPSEHQIN